MAQRKERHRSRAGAQRPSSMRPRSKRNARRATAIWARVRAALLRDLRVCSSSFRIPRTALDAQKEQNGAGLNEQVTSDEIAEVVSAWTGVPVSKMMQGELDKLTGLEGELHKRVIGQDEAVSAVAGSRAPQPRGPLRSGHARSAASSSWAPPAWARPSSPRRWPSACSMTSSALVRIDMSEYMEKFSVQRLIGAPPGYVGYDEGGQLTEAVRRRPYSVDLARRDRERRTRMSSTCCCRCSTTAV